MSAREVQQWRAMLARSFEPRDWFVNDDAPEETPRIVWQYCKVWDHYEVGFRSPDGRWVQRQRYNRIDEAVEATHRLNRA